MSFDKIHHPWDISPAEAIALQKKLVGLVREESLAGDINTVAGVDCAFTDDGRIVAVAVLCDAATMDVLTTAIEVQPCRFPYVSGLLSFREAPAVIAAVQKLTPKPDLLMCDGQGIAHPRELGLASHVGLWVNIPTIGVAKAASAENIKNQDQNAAQKRNCNFTIKRAASYYGRGITSNRCIFPSAIASHWINAWIGFYGPAKVIACPNPRV